MNIELLIIFWAGHYLADFPLQPAFVAEKKGLVFVESIGFHCLTAHAFIHGLIAGALAQNVGIVDWFLFGLTIGLTHWLIDFGKSSILLKDLPHTKGARNQFQSTGFYGINIDQALHLLVITGCLLFIR